MKSVVAFSRPHKFFERYLDNDLQILSAELQDRYAKIEMAKVIGTSLTKDSEAWKESNSVSTMKWKQYNVFQFHLYELHKLFKAVREMTIEACNYYNLEFEKQFYMVQGWFNINYAGKGKLNWHDHGPIGAPNFHGYYSVNAEPSVTYYRIFDNEIENHNKNNRAILSEMGHLHAMADWDWEGPRITVAYDIVPLKRLKFKINQEQHWIPLI